MKQSLGLRLNQQLTMTPQLQQAIRLLQLSSLELEVEVQQAIESNPMLEQTEEGDDPDAIGQDEISGDDPEPTGDETTADGEASEFDGDESGFDGDGAETEFDPTDAALNGAEAEASASLEDIVESEVTMDAADSTIPEDLPVDSNWDDLYQGMPAPGPAAEERESDDRNGTSESLAEHLSWQLNLTPVSDRDRAIGMAIIDSIDADGMLGASADEIASSFTADPPLETDEVEAVLKLLQQFDPPGVGARNLQECLSLQLRQLPDDTFWRDEAQHLIDDHFDLLAARDFATLRRRAGLDEDSLLRVVELIQSLNPRPGSSIGEGDPGYIEPDVIVTRRSGRWHVELNPETTPKVRINADYACLVRRADTSAENTYLRNNLQEARWFLKSLQSRSETLLKVATKIVEHQRGFLEYGDEAMRPLVLAEIAESVEMHESTISRVTTRKYMLTPRGIYELKYFFSSHVGTGSGGEVSSTAIRALIRKMVGEENPQKPLSDNKIAKMLNEQNIEVARRTVAKYRESMSIPPSNERKRLV